MGSTYPKAGFGFFNRNVFDSCVISSEYFGMDIISLSVPQNLEEIVRFEVEVRVYEKFAKM